MDKVVFRICPLDLMMKYVQFQVKKRLSHEVPKVIVELSSAVGLSVHPLLSATSTHLVRSRIWQGISIKVAC